MALSENARKIVENRYLMNNEQGWEDVCKRVSTYISAAEVLYTVGLKDLDGIKEFNQTLYDDLVARRFIFNSPTLFNAGSGIDPDILYKPIDELTFDDYEEIYSQRNKKNSLSACFVIPVNNSIEDIFKAIKEASLITKAGGGVGFNFSHLSHKGRALDSGAGFASGPLSFIDVFDSAAQAVMQGGRRRAAQLGTLRYDHPDIIDFINAKNDKKSFKFFNFSVMIDEEFIEAVNSNSNIILCDPVTSVPIKEIPAADILDAIALRAWETGDPGLLFYHTLNRDGYIQDEVIESTNPCGEIGTYFYGSCNLGHINLNELITKDNELNSSSFETLIHRGVHYLDNVIDMNWYPLSDITRFSASYRPIGLGVMGFAHALFKLGIHYDSREARDLGSKWAEILMKTSNEASKELAIKRGSYPEFDFDVWSKKHTSLLLPKAVIESIRDNGIRNASVNAVAPTGTCSLIADTSSGIEPVFALVHSRVFIDKSGKEKTILVKDPIYEQSDVPDAPYFVDALHVSTNGHILMQAVWQQFIDQSISKTINMPSSATVEDVRNAFLLAEVSGCKGITIFRDGCREEQVLYAGSKPTGIIPKSRPKTTYGRTSEVKIGCGTLYITLNLDEDGKPIEAFLTTGKGGGCRASSEGLGRMISINLRSGIAVEEVIKQLEHIKCPSCVNKGTIKVMSCPDAVARELKSIVADKNLSNGKVCDIIVEPDDVQGIKCEECGYTMIVQEGCITCPSCGFSRCS